MICQACEREEHWNCNMTTWCECECDGPYGWPYDFEAENYAQKEFDSQNAWVEE